MKRTLSDWSVRDCDQVCQWRRKIPQKGRSKIPQFGRSKIPHRAARRGAITQRRGSPRGQGADALAPITGLVDPAAALDPIHPEAGAEHPQPQGLATDRDAVNLATLLGGQCGT
jgi:hypothetical protein